MTMTATAAPEAEVAPTTEQNDKVHPMNDKVKALRRKINTLAMKVYKARN